MKKFFHENEKFVFAVHLGCIILCWSNNECEFFLIRKMTEDNESATLLSPADADDDEPGHNYWCCLWPKKDKAATAPATANFTK